MQDIETAFLVFYLSFLSSNHCPFKYNLTHGSNDIHHFVHAPPVPSVSSQCCEGGIISPTSCLYITKWLAVPDDHSTNENYTW